MSTGDGSIRVEVAGPVQQIPAATEDLLRWLSEQPALRGRATPVLSSVGPGHMAGGGLIEALTVAVGAGGAVTVLAQALVVWARQPRGSEVRIRLVAADGTRTEIDTDRFQDVEVVIKAAAQAHAAAAGRPAPAPSQASDNDGQGGAA
ncbi:hypothetical protein ABZ642_05685 [Streptomyces sp. NPDC007157]|uniref:effector-associated constant component EACC1 n=1 Tax=Streptomyces sp. NPDC007157 TaxID=3154681 RepID=UPI0033F8C37A